MTGECEARLAEVLADKVASWLIDGGWVDAHPGGGTAEGLHDNLEEFLTYEIDHLDLAGSRRDGLAVEAVRELHRRREQVVMDEEECAEGSCGHPEGTCITLATAVCAHCAAQTEPDEAWEWMIRPEAYWPCATERAIAHVAQAIAADERDVAAAAWDEGWEAAATAIDQPGYGTAALRLRHLARTGRARADRLTATGDQP